MLLALGACVSAQFQSRPSKLVQRPLLVSSTHIRHCTEQSAPLYPHDGRIRTVALCNCICLYSYTMLTQWMCILLLIFALWNNVYSQGPLIYYEGNAEFFCPDDSNEWFLSGGYCHSVVLNVSNWQDAARTCARQGGVLFHINDSMETWDISWRLHHTISSNDDDTDQTTSLFWTTYQFTGSNNTKLATSCQTEASALTPLWAMGQPKERGDFGCVALDVNVTDPDSYGWRTADCQSSLPYLCSFLACQKDEFRCHDHTRCISEAWACDGVEDCPDASDEIGCAVECGPDVMTNLTGSISSPNFPRSNYPDDATCLWRILLPEQYKILLKITSFDTERFYDVLYGKEGSSFKEWDSLPEAFNKSGPLTSERFQYRSATNSILLKFVSDNSITRPGFLLSWEADDSIKNCVPEEALLASNTERELTSPGYHSGQYPINVICVWVIQNWARTGLISIHFTDFQLAKPDWLEVYYLPDANNNQSGGVLIDTYNMEHPPFVLTSASGAFRVVFYSDTTRNAKGFSLVYKTGCSGLIINATYAYFRSPRGAENGSRMDCEWKLYHPTGKKITLILRDVSLYENDSITIDDGRDDTVFSNGSVVVPVPSKGSSIVVRFRATSPYSHFNASFSEDCLSPPAVSHSTASTTSIHYGVDVRYVCESGYLLIGGENLTCGPNGNWSGAAPRCSPVDCAAPPRLRHAILQAVTCTPPEKPLSCIAAYACEPGCTPGRMQMHCADGVWQPVTDVCKPVTCSAPPAPPANAVFAAPVTPMYFLHDVVEYSCQQPYVPIGPSFAVCTATGQWLRSDFSCRLPSCRPSSVVFGRPLNVAHVYNQSLTDLKCLPGFRQSASSFKCAWNSTWSPELVCRDVNECESSQSATVCPIGTCRNLIGSWLCDCSRGWRWNADTNQCEDINECLTGAHECDEDALCENTHGGYLCHCPLGSILFNGRNALANSIVNLRVNRSCVPVHCPRPVYNTSTTRLLTNHSIFGYEAEIMFVCKYAIGDDFSLPVKAVCGQDGQWSANAPVCPVASCAPPNSIVNGRFEPIFEPGSTIPPGTTIEYFCEDGFMLMGLKRRICSGVALMWTGPDPACQRTQCPQLDAPSGGFVTYESNRVNGTRAYFYCDPMHQLTGSQYMDCGLDGCWKGQRPLCRRVKCNLTNLPELMTSQTGASSGVEIGGTVQLGCLLDGYVISDRRPISCVSKTDLPLFPEPGAAVGRGQHDSDGRGTYPTECSSLGIGKITSDTYVTQGETVDLTCLIDADCDGFQITWERGRALVDYSDSIQREDRMAIIQTGAQSYTLQIRNVSPSDSGYYWCKVWHRNEVQIQKKVLLVVTAQADEVERGKRGAPADQLRPDTVYLFDTIDNATGGHWTEYNNTNQMGGAEAILPAANVECRPGGQWAEDPFGGTCACKRGYIRVNSACVKRGPLCYTCEQTDSIGQCNRRSKLQWCGADEVCSMIVSTNGTFKLWKGCVSANRCHNRIINVSNCVRGMENCQLCCADDYCNVVPFQMTSPVWNSTLPSCIDVQPPRFLNCTGSNTTVMLGVDGNPVIPIDGSSDDLMPFPLPVATDNSGSVAVVSDPPGLQSPSIFAQPSTRITLTATDGANLTATCSFYVVTRRLSPGLDCGQNVVFDTANVTGDSGRSAPTRYPLFNFTDGRSVLNRTFDPPRGAMVEIGRPVVVTMTGRDQFGSAVACTFRYVIQPSGCPVWTLPGFRDTQPRPLCSDLNAGRNNWKAIGTRCVLPNQDCSGGIWTNGRSPFTFVCNVRGMWTAEGGNNTDISFWPSCADVYPPSVAFILNVTYTFSSHNSSAPNNVCIGQYTTQLRDAAVHAFHNVCQAVSASSVPLVAVDLLSAKNETLAFRVNCTVRPNEANQSTNVLDCLQRLSIQVLADEKMVTVGGSGGCPIPNEVQREVVVQRVEDCPPGNVRRYENNATDYYVCARCPAGTFAGVDKTDCAPCPVGSYQNDSGRTECLPCPNGTTSVHPVSTSIMDCLALCPLSYYSDTGIEPCLACPIGTFQTTIGGQRCTPCPNGTATAQPGASSDSECKNVCQPGTYGERGVWPCFHCPLGYVQPSPYSTSCTKCPNGTTTTSIGTKDFSQCTDVPQCSADWCLNGGTCISAWPESQCLCPVGTYGKHCQLLLRVCDNSTCKNGGLCSVSTADGPVNCSCPKGYTGRYCQHKPASAPLPVQSEPLRDECSSIRCGHCYCDRGVSSFTPPTKEICEWNVSFDQCGCSPCSLCVAESTVSCKLGSDLARFTCVCKDGWEGEYCERMVDPCQKNGSCRGDATRAPSCQSPSPCQNGAVCRLVDGFYYCDCWMDHFGYHCQRTPNACSAFPCANGATCTRNDSDPSKYRCQCASGWTGDQCDREIDLCESQPCANGGECYSYFNGSYCLCNGSWTGLTCSEPVDPCATHQCYSGGTCQGDLAGGARCVCYPPWTGIHCETYQCVESGLCWDNQTCIQYPTGGQCEQKPVGRCQDAFCANGGKCQLNDTYGYTCDCPAGYGGETCSDVVDACAQNMCQNNGTCRASPSTTVGYVCYCQLGYLGQYCEQTVSGCDQNPCKNGATCVDVQTTVYCLCTAAYTGQFCDKAKSQDFNMRFVGRTDTNMTWVVTPEFSLDEKMNGMTLCFWVRFANTEDQSPRSMTYVTVARVRKNKARAGETNLLPFIRFTESGLLLNKPGETDRALMIRLPVNDTSWHFVCFQWHWSSLQWIVYVDGHRFRTNQEFQRDSFNPSSITQGQYIILLGQSVDKQRYFTGELSMVMLLSSLDFTGPDITKYYTSCGDSLLSGDDSAGKVSFSARWIEFTQPESGDPSVLIKHPSVCSQAHCLPDQHTCKTDKIPPEVKYCPKDVVVWGPARLTVVTWKEPRFTDNIELARVSSNFRNGQLLPWGEYHVVYSAHDKAGNGAYCKFRVYVTPFKCETLGVPTEGTLVECQKFGDGVYCTVNCTDGHRFVSPVRPFYVCGVEGAYDPLRPDVPPLVPACGTPVNQPDRAGVWTRVQARLRPIGRSVCGDNTTLQLIRNTIVDRLAIRAVNGTYALCNGGHDQCDSSNVVRVICDEEEMGRWRRTANHTTQSFIDFSLKWRSSNTSHLHSLVADALHSASPSLFTVSNLSSSVMCPPGSVLMDNICILCSIGTFYDWNMETCVPCPLNMYNSQAGRHSCTQCQNGQITPTVGAQFLRDCIDNCTPGYYFDYNTRLCTPCGIGLYQSRYGSTSCYSCSPGQTTLHPGSNDVHDCEFLCGAGEELDSTGLGCIPCPVGTYKTSKNDTACARCPMDYTTLTAGASGEKNCSVLYCSAGKYRRGGECLVCPIGTYQDQWDQTECKDCPVDTVTRFPGTDSVWDCRSGGCRDLCSLCSSNATCTFDACQTTCTCKAGYKYSGNSTHRCIDKCQGACTPGQLCSLSNENDPVCRTPISSDVKAISTIVGAASGGFVAIVLIVTLVVIFKVRLYQLVRCCKRPSVKEMSSDQYYRSTTLPGIGTQLRSIGRRGSPVRPTDNEKNARIACTLHSGTSAAPECIRMHELRPDSEVSGQETNEFDMMTAGEVYSAIYEGLRGLRTDRSLSDYITTGSQSTAVFDNQCLDIDDTCGAYPDGRLTPDLTTYRRSRLASDDEDDYFS